MGRLIRSVLLGPPGTARDVVGAVLALAGFTVVLGRRAALARGGDATPTVQVLVNPRPEDWEAARGLGRGVVLVSEEPVGAGDVFDAVLRGADAVVSADASPAELARAVEAVGRGETVLDPAVARRLATAARAGRDPARPPRLTPRERAILASIERGESVKQTARSLGIATKTVENLQSRLFRKLGAANRAHAVALVHRLGLLEVAGAAPERGVR